MVKQHRPGLRGLDPDDPQLAGPELECEECGVVYDQLRGAGLCGYCAGDAAALYDLDELEEGEEPGPY